jgi:hypothetical protein
MVHALETVRGLLNPAGRLLDIHPLTERAEFQVRVGGNLVHAGWLRETDGGIEYANAERAIATVVARGLFVAEERRAFEFVHHAGSLAEMRAHLARTWKDAVIDEGVALRIQALADEAGPGGEILLREEPCLTRLRLWAPPCARSAPPRARRPRRGWSR